MKEGGQGNYYADIQQELADDGTMSGIEREDDDSIQKPFDPDKISISSQIVAMDTLVRRLKQGSIVLAPDFQRSFVWDSTRCSRLIESLMLKITLPMFYVSSDNHGVWHVVDGLQRLTAIKNFLLNKKYGGESSVLVNLEFLGDKFNGLSYADLEKDSSSARIVNNIMETELRFTVINPGTPDEVKRNIFKRINTGGLPLTGQEIRHALYSGASTVLLHELVNSYDFVNYVSGSLNDSRMAVREIVLRFLAFSIFPKDKYHGDMDKFLSDAMQMMNCVGGENGKFESSIKDGFVDYGVSLNSLDALRERFSTAMGRAYELFGDHAFRKSTAGSARAPVNKALFEVWGNVLADLSIDNFKILRARKQIFLIKVKNLLQKTQFERAIGRASTTIAGVKERYELVLGVVSDVLEGRDD